MLYNNIWHKLVVFVVKKVNGKEAAIFCTKIAQIHKQKKIDAVAESS